MMNEPEKFIGKEQKSSKVKKSLQKDGMTYEITVEEVEGGYIITKSMWGEKKLDKPKDGRTTEYISKEKKYVSATNPFDKEKESDDEELDFSLSSAMKSISEMEGSII